MPPCKLNTWGLIVVGFATFLTVHGLATHLYCPKFWTYPGSQTLTCTLNATGFLIDRQQCLLHFKSTPNIIGFRNACAAVISEACSETHTGEPCACTSSVNNFYTFKFNTVASKLSEKVKFWTCQVRCNDSLLEGDEVVSQGCSSPVFVDKIRTGDLQLSCPRVIVDGATNILTCKVNATAVANENCLSISFITLELIVPHNMPALSLAGLHPWNDTVNEQLAKSPFNECSAEWANNARCVKKDPATNEYTYEMKFVADIANHSRRSLRCWSDCQPVVQTAPILLSAAYSTCDPIRFEDPCRSNPCKNGTCDIDGDSIVCNCTAGFQGERCNYIDHCYRNPCVHGTCYQSDHNYVCNCTAGFQGEICNDTDPCYPDPCVHGTCHKIGSNYKCNCAVGFQGEICNDTDPCYPDPCVHGTCHQIGRNYTCNCAVEFKGETCNVTVLVRTADNAAVVWVYAVVGVVLLTGVAAAAESVIKPKRCRQQRSFDK